MSLDPAAPQAFVDETFRECLTSGFYVVAAAVFALAEQDEATSGMLRLRGRRGISKLHWSQMDHPQRKAAVTQLAEVGGPHMVVVGRPVPRRRQDRARAACLSALVAELHQRGVEELLIEARTPSLDRRDIDTISGSGTGCRRMLGSGLGTCRVVSSRCSGPPTFSPARCGPVTTVVVNTGSYSRTVSRRYASL